MRLIDDKGESIFEKRCWHQPQSRQGAWPPTLLALADEVIE
jgi:hypothetical protein